MSCQLIRELVCRWAALGLVRLPDPWYSLHPIKQFIKEISELRLRPREEELYQGSGSARPFYRRMKRAEACSLLSRILATSRGENIDAPVVLLLRSGVSLSSVIRKEPRMIHLLLRIFDFNISLLLLIFFKVWEIFVGKIFSVWEMRVFPDFLCALSQRFYCLFFMIWNQINLVDMVSNLV